MEWVSWSGAAVFVLGVLSVLAGVGAVGFGWALHGGAGAVAGVLLAVLGRVALAGGRRWRHLREVP